MWMQVLAPLKWPGVYIFCIYVCNMDLYCYVALIVIQYNFALMHGQLWLCIVILLLWCFLLAIIFLDSLLPECYYCYVLMNYYFLLTFHWVILRSNFVSYILASHSSVVLIKSSWDKILSKDTLLLFNIMYIQSLVSFSVKSSYIQISWVYILLGYIEIVSDWLVMPQVKCDLIWLIEESYVLPSYQHSIWL